MPEQPLTIRAATPHDLDRLRPRLSGLALLAEHHGRAVAAIALTSGRIAADASPAQRRSRARAPAAPLPAAAPGRRRRVPSARCCGASRPPDPPPNPKEILPNAPHQIHPPRSRSAPPSRAPRSALVPALASANKQPTCTYDRPARARSTSSTTATASTLQIVRVGIKIAAQRNGSDGTRPAASAARGSSLTPPSQHRQDRRNVIRDRSRCPPATAVHDRRSARAGAFAPGLHHRGRPAPPRSRSLVAKARDSCGQRARLEDRSAPPPRDAIRVGGPRRSSTSGGDKRHRRRPCSPARRTSRLDGGAGADFLSGQGIDNDGGSADRRRLVLDGGSERRHPVRGPDRDDTSSAGSAATTHCSSVDSAARHRRRRARLRQPPSPTSSTTSRRRRVDVISARSGACALAPRAEGRGGQDRAAERCAGSTRRHGASCASVELQRVPRREGRRHRRRPPRPAAASRAPAPSSSWPAPSSATTASGSPRSWPCGCRSRSPARTCASTCGPPTATGSGSSSATPD